MINYIIKTVFKGTHNIFKNEKIPGAEGLITFRNHVRWSSIFPHVLVLAIKKTCVPFIYIDE